MLRKAPLIISPTPQVYTINELWKMYKENEIDFNAEYQRSEVWKKDKKQKLIDSILRGYSIGLIIFRKKEGGKLEVLDGQQRLRSIFQFMENKFRTSGKFTPDYADKSFDDIKKNPGLYADFISFKIPYLTIESSDEKLVTEIFLRLQEGLSLNASEKLNAKLGKMRDLIIDLSKYGNLLKLTGIDERRFAHRLLTAQIFYLEKETRWNDSPPTFPTRVHFNELMQMYEKYKTTNPPSHVVAQVKRIFNLIKEMLDVRVIRKRSDFVTIYLVTSYIERKYVIDEEFRKKFKDFVIDFLSKVECVDMRNPREGEEDYAEYRINRRYISSPTRFKIMLKYLLEKVPNLKLKDNKREFDYGQKLAIYHRAKGKCEYCGKEVYFDEAHFHHKKPWIRGGLTTVDNGMLVHPSCHFKLHHGKLNEE
ncbi:MAG: DUF262 domain-containing protein [Candidatus Aenigmarchaeota archaeon]|nr:DUF262 domain-containing protein [Candidatus Aenigmarchaeota archaeon]